MLRTVFSRIAIASIFCFLGVQAAPAQDKPAGDTPKTSEVKATSAPVAPKPGKDRWLVKTASDPDAKKINTRTQQTTIEKLLALPRPKEMPLDGSNPAYQEKRAVPVEMTIYSVEADIVECQLMRDGDYRVVLKGASGKTLILEMPDPAPDFVSPDSPFFYSIKAAREQFNARVKPEITVTPVQAHARVTGIGYFARAYGKQKPEGNLIQLHPVLQIEWMAQPGKEFAKAAQNERTKSGTEFKKP